MLDKLHFTLEPYLLGRYFEVDKLCGLTTKFGGYKGAKYLVGCDCHETKLHSRFSRATNSVENRHLINCSQGT